MRRKEAEGMQAENRQNRSAQEVKENGNEIGREDGRKTDILLFNAHAKL